MISTPCKTRWLVAILILAAGILSPLKGWTKAPSLTLNDKEYFETAGLNVLVFSNWYDGLFSDSKTSGVELIHHGLRSATNGDVRLQTTPEQWDPIPKFKERKINKAEQSIEAFMEYPDYHFEFSIKVQAQNDGVTISVNLPKALPAALENHAGFNLEFLPSAYFHKAFLMDEACGLLPYYPTGLKEINGLANPLPLAQGHKLVLAPGDTERQVSIESNTTSIALYDGRAKAQNGWFVVRSLLPANKTGKVLEWQLRAVSQPNWLREPVIGHSQVGYHPAQKKVAVIELDKNDKRKPDITLLKINADGSTSKVLQNKGKDWGNYLRYQYRKFDFSNINEPGLYLIEYGNQRTEPFRIASDALSNAWQPSLDMYLPIQMDHMMVNEAYRVWHGASHLDDALQAPVNHEHFDLYAQGPTTDTPFKPGEHIPGLNIGGWFDAGDFDIRTQTHYDVVTNLVNVTSVDYRKKLVELHQADGKPDLLQQIEHGTLALIAQYRAVGHAIPGIVEAHIDQYTHLGDASTKTDNLIFDAKKSEGDSDGFKSGTFDDRWAFTSKSSPLNYGSMAALAAASRALAQQNPALANEAINTAKKAWAEEQAKAKPDLFHSGNTTGGKLEDEKIKAATELLIATGDKQYAAAITELLPQLKASFSAHIPFLLRAMPLMPKEFATDIRKLSEDYTANVAKMGNKNPYAVPITEGGWAGNGWVIRFAINNYYLHKAFPDLVDRESVLQSLNYLYGTHPAHNLSFVSNVGTHAKEVAYGMNRADFTSIPGGVVPGVLILKPDYPENHEDWPFFWGENEYVIDEAASYIFLVNAAEELLKEQ
jgi:hypothetical protein